MKNLFAIVFGVLVTFQFDHNEPMTFNKIKLYKGPAENALAVVKTVDVVPSSATTFTVEHDFTDSNPQVFGVSVANNFGESTITTRDDNGGLMIVGKPSAPVRFKVTVSGQN